MTISVCFKTEDEKIFETFDAAQLHECLKKSGLYLDEWKERQLITIITDHFLLEAKPVLAEVPSESPTNE